MSVSCRICRKDTLSILKYDQSLHRPFCSKFAGSGNSTTLLLSMLAIATAGTSTLSGQNSLQFDFCADCKKHGLVVGSAGRIGCLSIGIHLDTNKALVELIHFLLVWPAWFLLVWLAWYLPFTPAVRWRIFSQGPHVCGKAAPWDPTVRGFF